MVFVVAGGLFVTSGLDSGGLDLRASSVTDLDTVVRQQRERTDTQQQQVAALTKEVDRLGKNVDDAQVSNLQQQVDELRGPAGFESVHGPAITVVLSDAPKEEIDRAVEKGEVTADQLVVHQQDIQAVVNALWSGGAEAMTLQKQRVISTTGIKCSGSTIQLQGVPYPQPFVIDAVGNVDDMLRSVDGDSYVQLYRQQAENPDISIGWNMRAESRLTAPAYAGLRDLSYARPIH